MEASRFCYCLGTIEILGGLSNCFHLWFLPCMVWKMCCDSAVFNIVVVFDSRHGDFNFDNPSLISALGARPADVLNYIAAYYKQHSKTRDGRANVIDRPFQEQVWKWLTRHAEIHVGRENQGNGLSLSEVQAWNTSDTQGDDVKVPLKTAEQISPGEAENVPSAAPQASEDHDARSPLQPQPTSASQGTGSGTSSQPQLAPNPQDKSSKHASLRVYTSQSRMWSATAGHAPDFNRIPRLDFILLSIIAARRGKGILQPDLVRVSGQDKRSVPKRTERLHDSGYIEKKAVSAKGNRTSLCVLKRFTTAGAVSIQEARADGDSYGQDIADRRLVLKENLKNSVVEVEVLLQAILDIVRPIQIITWDNLKRRLVCASLRVIKYFLSISLNISLYRVSGDMHGSLDLQPPPFAGWRWWAAQNGYVPPATTQDQARYTTDV